MRIEFAVAREAGLERLDYLLVTHYTTTSAASGSPRSFQSALFRRLRRTARLRPHDRRRFRAYEPVCWCATSKRDQESNCHEGLEADIVSAGGSCCRSRSGAGEKNAACVELELHRGRHGKLPVRGRDVPVRSVRFLDLGDLSGNPDRDRRPTRAAPDRVRVPGRASGDYDSNVPALYAALRPHVAILNNGVTKGGAPVTFTTLHAQTGMDLWQLHASQNPGAENAPDPFIANVDDGTTGYWIKLTANEDGSFRLVNGRTGWTKPYSPRPGIDRR
jgi:hypothetical protein